MSIYKKLNSVRKAVGAIPKDNKNPFFNSSYFDINSLISHVDSELQKNDLLLLQPVISNCVYTQIIDIETGEKVESSMCLPEIVDPQKMGSSITYFRRYTLQSLLALESADDDDGNTSNPKYQKALEVIESGDKERIKEMESRLTQSGLNQKLQKSLRTKIINSLK